jgi:hypothetical protein
VAGEQRAGATAHRVPARRGLGGVGGLAEHPPVEQQHRVAADDEAVRQPDCDDRGLLGRQLLDDLARLGGLDLRLVEVAHDDLRVEAGVAQQPQPGRRGAGEHEGTVRHAHQRYRRRRDGPLEPCAQRSGTTVGGVVGLSPPTGRPPRRA